MAAKNPARRQLAAQVAINERLSRLSTDDRRQMTAAARAARRQKIADEIDPNQELDPADLAARVDARIRADLAKASLARAAALRAEREAAKVAELDALAEQASS